MALTFSHPFPMGADAPEFHLRDVVTDNKYTFHQLSAGMVTVVAFICNHCPYVKHIQNELAAIANTYINEGVSFIAINSNDAEAFPEDSPEKMKEAALELGYPFPYLYDETQEVAKSYKAACTPDFYIFDHKGKCVYHGRFDASNHKNGVEPTGEDLVFAIELTLAGQQMPESDMQPSSGCNIKWKSGVSPF
jgi:thiol-disulfide isomerase/thioredoxin